MNGSAQRKLKWTGLRRSVLYAALSLTFACFAFFHWVIWPAKISGDSMVPNYTDGQPIYINKFAYWTEPPNRGDVVGIHVPEGEVYIKRVIGLPGERIDFKRGTVLINGRPLDEPYIEIPLLWLLPSLTLDADEYFVMGDNRQSSLLGKVHKRQIVGRAMF